MKKFLSLVLALVMTMSLVTVSAGAKDFTDNSKINYKEAVDVMSAAKVIDGYAEGDFRPTNTLTRGAAAKIICNLILGPTTASALVADAAPYKDVPTTNTFAGYIAYCQKEGIISGYADGTFRPGNSLTGYAFMKMLLGALGYDAETENYTGNNWSINVAKRALNIGLDDDLTGDFNGVKAVNREEACLYAFNTLKATMVEYENNNSVTVNGITFTNKSAAKEMANTGKTDGNIKDDGLMQFAEKYFSKLSKKPANDDFKRPSTKWVYDGDSVGTYADSADAAVTLGSDKDFKTVLTDSDYMNYDSGDVKADAVVYVNGFEAGTYKDLKSVKLGVGDVVEAFENDDDDVTRIVVIRYLPAQIDEIDDSLSSSYTKKGASYSISFDKVDDGISNIVPTGTYYDSYTNDSDKELPGFNAKTYVEDAVIALAPEATNAEASDGKLAVTYGSVILDSYVAEKVSGTIKTYSTKDEYAYVDGTKYKFAANFDGVKSNYDKDSTYDVYTTSDGYALAIVGVDDAKLDDVYYVVGVYASDSNYAGKTYYAQVVNVTTGEASEIKLEGTEQASAIASAITANERNKVFTAIGGLYTFEDKKTGDSKANNNKFNAIEYKGDSKFSYSIAKDTTAGNALSADVKKDSSSVSLNSGKTSTNVNYLVGIEEPELNMHPQAQRQLIETLKNKSQYPNTQFILTTHSTVIIDKLGHTSIVLCRKSTVPSRNIVTSATQISSDFWLKYNFNQERYYNFYQYKNSEFFFSNYIIITESPTDCNIISALLSKCGIDIESKAISLIPADGEKSVKYPYALAKELGIPFVCIVDRDVFQPYLRYNRKESLDTDGIPQYRPERKQSSPIYDLIKPDDITEIIRAFTKNNYNHVLELLEPYHIISMRYAIEIDLAICRTYCDAICNILELSEENKNMSFLLKNRSSRIKDYDVITSTFDLVSTKNLPKSYKKIISDTRKMIESN